MRHLHSPKVKEGTLHFAEDDMLDEIDIFADIQESPDERQKRKARLDALEDLRHSRSLREQIDYLYDRQFVNLAHQNRSITNRKKDK